MTYNVFGKTLNLTRLSTTLNYHHHNPHQQQNNNGDIIFILIKSNQILYLRYKNLKKQNVTLQWNVSTLHKGSTNLH